MEPVNTSSPTTQKVDYDAICTRGVREEKKEKCVDTYLMVEADNTVVNQF